MPNRWQRECTCDVCGRRTTKVKGELRTLGHMGWQRTWVVCDSCLDLIFNWRGALTWADLGYDGEVA